MPDFPSLAPAEHGAKITSIFDFSPEVLGQLVDYITQSGIPTPISQIVGFPTQSRFLDRSTSSVDVTNTVTETSIYTFSVKAGDMGTDRMLRLTLAGDYIYNSSAVNLTFKVKFGGTTFYARTNNSTTIGANRQPWFVQLIVGNLGAANSQFMAGMANLGAASDGAPTSGIGNAFFLTPSSVPLGNIGITTLGTIDTSTAQSLDLTITWGTATTLVSWRKRYGFLELL